MAKALGLIGNFTGKLGNTVGYNLKDSNNKQTQGVRVYQPVVKNPKTAAQAEQRAKLAPINATYRLLKDIIDRGQEGVAYGNKSRLAWLKNALSNFEGYWTLKGANVERPGVVQLTKGSLYNPFSGGTSGEGTVISLENVPQAGYATLGEFVTQILATYKSLKAGQQLTFISISRHDSTLVSAYDSIILDPTSTDPMPTWFLRSGNDFLAKPGTISDSYYACILSEEGADGQHLRSTEKLTVHIDIFDVHPLNENKDAAIASYMAAGANTDWAEESIM